VSISQSSFPIQDSPQDAPAICAFANSFRSQHAMQHKIEPQQLNQHRLSSTRAASSNGRGMLEVSELGAQQSEQNISLPPSSQLVTYFEGTCRTKIQYDTSRAVLLPESLGTYRIGVQ
jgi:hypothetical protein